MLRRQSEDIISLNQEVSSQKMAMKIGDNQTLFDDPATFLIAPVEQKRRKFRNVICFCHLDNGSTEETLMRVDRYLRNLSKPDPEISMSSGGEVQTTSSGSRATDKLKFLL